MNKYVCCFLILSAQVVLGQRIRMASEQSPQDRQEIEKSYSAEQGSFADRTRLGAGVKSAVDAVFPKTPASGVVIFVQVYVGKDGGVKDVVLDLPYAPKFNKDSLALEFSKHLAKTMSGFKSEHPGKTASHHLSMSIGSFKEERKVMKVDSSLSDVVKALAFQDSLGIKRLFFHELELQDLPAVIYRFPNLEELYLQKNQLTSVTLDMGRLPKLKQINLQANRITNDGLHISRNKSLWLLQLNHNKFDDIPRSVANSRRLESLWIGGNVLERLSDRSFRRLRSVRDVNFYETGLKVLPDGIKKLKRLEVLDLYHNELTQLPDAITRLKRLTHLAVAHNQISGLPEKIYKLKYIHTLYAHHNRLSKLPGKIGQLTQMKILDLGFNWFTDFPKEITAFSKLQELDLSSNNFHEFPAKLLDMKGIEKLFLRGNPFLDDDGVQKYANQLTVLKSKNVEVFD
jgi:Leucine-rich repeat (LRR) protein